MNCLVRGGQEILDTIENDKSLKNKVEISCSTCLDGCNGDGSGSPVVSIDNQIYTNIGIDELINRINDLYLIKMQENKDGE